MHVYVTGALLTKDNKIETIIVIHKKKTPRQRKFVGSKDAATIIIVVCLKTGHTILGRKLAAFDSSLA